jgi:hypothetical protein
MKTTDKLLQFNGRCALAIRVNYLAKEVNKKTTQFFSFHIAITQSWNVYKRVKIYSYDIGYKLQDLLLIYEKRKFTEAASQLIIR